jgi:dihydrodipicolinate synthase/N-acetylneuraminate lyase
LLDAVISGPSSVLPEITVRLFQANAAGDSARFEQLAVLFSEALDRLEEFPYPWGLKLLADRRGLFPAQLPFPSGAARQVQFQGLAAWFAGWMPRLDEALA